MEGRRLTGPLAWRIGGGEIERDDAVAHRDRHRELDRPVDRDAVAVEQALRRCRRIRRQPGDRGAQSVGGSLQDGGEARAQCLGAEPCAQLTDPGGAHLRDGDLRMHVAAHQRRLAAVAEDEALDVRQRPARIPDLDRRDQQPFVIHLGGVGGRRSRDGAAEIGLVGDRARKGDDPAAGEHRRDERHVGDVGQAAFIGVIGDEHVAVADAVVRVRAVKRKDAPDQMAIDRGMEKHRRRDDQPAVAVEDHAGKIPQFADDGGIAGAVEMVMHFFHQARDLVAQDLDGDGVQTGVHLLRPRFRQDQVAKGIDGSDPARRDRGGGVELLDDGGARQAGAGIEPVALIKRRRRRPRALEADGALAFAGSLRPGGALTIALRAARIWAPRRAGAGDS